MDRICRNCRKTFPLDDLTKSETGWRCKEPCKKINWNKHKNEQGKFRSFEENEACAGDHTQSKKYVITCAISNAPVESRFLDCLKVYCEHNDAELKIALTKHRNTEDLFWDERITEYAFNERLVLNSNLVVYGDVNILPTASVPLSGFDSFGGDLSTIIPHPKIQLKTVPTPHNKLPKLLFTTGAITKPNYSSTKAGQKAEFHHSLSAVVIEVKDDRIFHQRYLHYKDGSFYDLNKEYCFDGTINESCVDALVLGDDHALFFDPLVYKGTFSDSNSLVNTVKPKVIVHHDILDQYATNHHHRGDPFIEIAKQKSGLNNVKAELEGVAKFLQDINKIHECEHVIVGSNHNDALSRWIKDADWKDDPTNAETYLETALAMCKESVSAFGYWMQRLLPSNLRYRLLERDESYFLNGIELGFHGDQGANGARGSVAQFARSGSKYIIGHSHAPCIFENVYQTGTSSLLKLGYNHGLSGWLQTHCLVYPNGKRTLVHMIDGEYC